MIKRLDVDDIAKIMRLEDPDFLESFPCDLGEWVQYLIKMVDNPNFYICGSVENGELLGYVVAVNAVLPPVSKFVNIAYYKSPGYKEGLEILEDLEKWAAHIGAEEIIFSSKKVGVFEKYGFTTKAFVMSKGI